MVFNFNSHSRKESDKIDKINGDDEKYFNSHSRKESDCTIVRFLDILLQ